MATQNEVLRHVGYEWWMFRATRHLILNGSPGPQGIVIGNAASDSNFVHARVLAHFFFDAGQQSRGDDWTAKTLGMERPPLPPVLDDVCKHVNKRVAHLTEGRAPSGFSYPDPSKVEQLLAERIQALKTSLGTAMPPRWIGDSPVPST